MKAFLRRLSKGIPGHVMHLLLHDRQKALPKLRDCGQDMRLAGEMLEEANKIICNLIKDSPTFGDREAAFNWAKKYYKP